MPKRPVLTQKMKDFCHAYVETSDAIEAYLRVYDTNNRGTASQESNKLLRRDDVADYIAKLNQPLVNKINNEREKKRQLLWKAIERCDKKEDEAGMARYLDILNKMDAEYVNINRNIDDSAEKLSQLNNDQLRQLLGETTEQTEYTEPTIPLQ